MTLSRTGLLVGGYLYATCFRFEYCSHGVALNGLEVTKECVETGGAPNTIARDLTEGLLMRSSH